MLLRSSEETKTGKTKTTPSHQIWARNVTFCWTLSVSPELDGDGILVPTGFSIFAPTQTRSSSAGHSQSIDPVTTRFHQGCCTIIARPSTTVRVSLNWMTFITYICTFPSPLCGFQRDFVCVILTNIQMSRVVSFGWFCTSELLRKPSYEINGFPPRRDNLSDICVDFEPCKSIGCKTS